MNRITKRTWIVGLFLGVLLCGLLLFVGEYVTDAEKWVSFSGSPHLYNSSNIGCGTITCNYDGKAKHRTVIGDHVFIGSNSSLVAPVTVGNGAKTGAGTVVIRDVPENSVVVGVPARPINQR